MKKRYLLTSVIVMALTLLAFAQSDLFYLYTGTAEKSYSMKTIDKIVPKLGADASLDSLLIVDKAGKTVERFRMTELDSISPVARTTPLIDCRIPFGSIFTSLPSFVDLYFFVKNNSLAQIPSFGLRNSDFEILEDGVKLPQSETYPYVYKMGDVPFIVKTVLMLDNSSSLGANNLALMKSAAVNFVRNKLPNQQIAVYSFSSAAATTLLKDYSTHTDSLVTAINAISLGYSTTDLYGAYIKGVNKLPVDYFSKNNILQGVLVMFTDGADTQGNNTLAQAVAARGSKLVYMVGLGNEITPSALNQLANPSPYVSATNGSELAAVFASIQEDIINTSKSLYRLNYMSPKRSGTARTVTVRIPNNQNKAANASYVASFNATPFQDAFGGVYLNVYDPKSNAYSGNVYGLPVDAVLKRGSSLSFLLDATTYCALSPVHYSWTSSDTRVATVEFDPKSTNRATVTFNPNSTGGDSEIKVTDLNNGFTRSVIARVIAPTIITSAATDLSHNSAVVGGNITTDGGASITDRGVCYAITQNPTISNNKVSGGTGSGSFVASLTGLSPNTNYFVRAYASNSEGMTYYGSQISFTTNSIPTKITDLDGNIYTIVTIGNQLWTVENWKCTKYNDGTAIPNVTDDTAWVNYPRGAYCVYYNNASYKDIYGLLYNRYVIHTNKIAPAGWRIPTYKDWLILTDYLIANGYNYDGTTTGNKIAKSMADVNNPNAQWESTSYVGTVGNKTNNPTYNNKSGFSALAGGYRVSGGGFHYQSKAAMWWGIGPSLPHIWHLFDSAPFFKAADSSPNLHDGHSIRLVRDL